MYLTSKNQAAEILPKAQYILFIIFCCLSISPTLKAQPTFSVSSKLQLDSHWYIRRADRISMDGCQLTQRPVETSKWLPAIVPGTLLSNLVRDKKYADPNIAFNNKKIPDVADVGVTFYTYWYYTTFNTPNKKPGEHIWLHLNGLNYSAQIFLNGTRVNKDTHNGMFLRARYDITPYLRPGRPNQLAVLVVPPDPPGIANGGQAGNGTIGKSVTNQFVAGWDWIAPVHDRNTGIWGKVFLTKTGPIQIRAPFVRPIVPGVREPGVDQAPAYLKTSAILYNAGATMKHGIIRVNVAGVSVHSSYRLASGGHKKISLPVIKIMHPKLWWPNGLGSHPLYPVHFTVFGTGTSLSDSFVVRTGIREITTHKNTVLQGQVFKINGQPVFIRGGNWIASDWMLRLSKRRYDAQIHYMADMHLNMLRVWGGGITERPDFYAACDRNGILVMQDLWITGDADGAWIDPKKKDSKRRRRYYPDNHSLFLKSAADQIKMLRNHPSLAVWSGGNEIAPPDDINGALKSKILPKLDPDRLYISHSTAQKLYTHSASVRADGPYNIQAPTTFFTHRSRPFNPEIGSVGLPIASTLRRIFPHNDTFPDGKGHVPSVWKYHKYISYIDKNGKDYIRQYGQVRDLDTFARYAQLVNYNQYRALLEGWNSHMWTWYSGVLIWKLQNPWTALRGEFFDWYLHPNGGLYGLMHGAEPVHIQYDPSSHSVQVVNNKFVTIRNARISATWYTLSGRAIQAGNKIVNLKANHEEKVFSIVMPSLKRDVHFLRLSLRDHQGNMVSRNFYWLHKSGASYRDLHKLKKVTIHASARFKRFEKTSKITVTLKNQTKARQSPVAFWLHLKLYNQNTNKLVSPVFYSDNYISLVPGEKRKIYIYVNNYSLRNNLTPNLELTGWNVNEIRIPVKRN